MEDFWGDSKHYKGKRRLVVIGHRGCGKNKTVMPVEIPDSNSRPSIMENTITSFNTAAIQGADFVEFDVQVTKDGCPIVFHDDYIVIAEENGYLSRSISELSLEEFLSIGYQKDSLKAGKVLVRQTVDGSFVIWKASIEDSLCTLQDCFEQVSSSIGFNIELKFNDTEPVAESEIMRTIDATLEVVDRCAKGRKIYFSSFHPDAVQILRRAQSDYPVFFLTDGGVNLYVDARRNSIEAAIEVCKKGGIQGIVSEVRAILQNAEVVNWVHKAGLCMLTYGEMNNVAEALRKQEECEVDGVIVDDVVEAWRTTMQASQEATSTIASYQTSLQPSSTPPTSTTSITSTLDPLVEPPLLKLVFA